MSLQTREQSTLVIVTILASASLLLITITSDGMFSINPKDVAILGIIFALIGFVYRQITVWTTDRKEHNRSPDRRERRDKIHEYYTYALFREFVLLFFLFIPIIFWALVLSTPDSIKTNNTLQLPDSISKCTGIISAIFASITVGLDYFIRMLDKWRNDPLRVHWRKRKCIPKPHHTRTYKVSKRQVWIFVLALSAGAGLALGVVNADLFGTHIQGIMPVKFAILAFAYVYTVISVGDYLIHKTVIGHSNRNVALFGVGFGIFLTEWSIRILLLVFKSLGFDLPFLKEPFP